MSQLSRRAVLSAALALALPLPLLAQSRGQTGLFIGHSFFVPVARQFDAIARGAGIAGHSADFVFAGGRNGTARSLWRDAQRRPVIEAALARGTIDLFALPGGANASYPSNDADYSNWINLALRHNPATRIFISQVWLPRGPRMDAEDFGQAISANAAETHAMVTRLRQSHPTADIVYGNHGIIAAAMKSAYDAGALRDLGALVGNRPGTLFRDQFGHAGQMMEYVMGLYWTERLYGLRAAALSAGGYDQDAIEQVLETARRLDARFS